MRNEHIKLIEPIVVDGRSITEITVRAPKVRDAKLIDRLDGMEKSIRLLAELTGQPASAIEDLSISDFKAIDAAATRLGEFPKAGGT